jgi:hypothetical protein
MANENSAKGDANFVKIKSLMLIMQMLKSKY